MDALIILEIAVAIIAFIFILKFIFGWKPKESDYLRSPDEIKEEIREFRRKLTKLKKDLPPKEYGQMMDDLMEEYYNAKEKE